MDALADVVEILWCCFCRCFCFWCVIHCFIIFLSYSIWRFWTHGIMSLGFSCFVVLFCLCICFKPVASLNVVSELYLQLLLTLISLEFYIIYFVLLMISLCLVMSHSLLYAFFIFSFVVSFLWCIFFKDVATVNKICWCRLCLIIWFFPFYHWYFKPLSDFYVIGCYRALLSTISLCYFFSVWYFFHCNNMTLLFSVLSFCFCCCCFKPKPIFFVVAEMWCCCFCHWFYFQCIICSFILLPILLSLFISHLWQYTLVIIYCVV